MDDAWLGKLFVRYRERRDGKALAAVFDATARELLGVAAHLAPSLDQAEDVVQTTFVRAIEHAGRYDASQSLKGWLYGILWREAAQLRRREGRRIEPAEARELAEDEPAASASQGELDEAVGLALARVPPPYREVLEPVLREERSTREVAAALARSPGTVRVQLSRGLERLRRELGTVRRLPRPSRLSALLAGGLPAMRGELLAHAGLAPGAVPAASSGFLAAQWAQATLGPGALAASAVLVAAVGIGVAELRPTAGATEGGPSVALAPAPTVATGAAELAPAASASSAQAPPHEREPASPAARPAANPRVVPADEVQIAGVVVDDAERALAGVRVVAEGENHYGYEATTTDDDGRFAFGGLAAGRWYVHADDERYARMWWQTNAVGIEEDDGEVFEAELKLVLYPPQRVAGVVVDESGSPVPATKVTLAVEWPAGRDEPLQGHLTQTVAETETDADGGFALERLVPGRMTVVLDHAEFARTLADFQVPGPAPRLVLARGMTLEGEVRLDGAPLADVGVSAHSTRESHLSMGDWDVRTDAQGRFELQRVSSVGDSRLDGVPTVSLSVEDPRWTSDALRVFESARGSLPWVTIDARPRGGALGTSDVGRDLAGEARRRGEPFGTASIRVRRSVPAPEALQVRLWLDGKPLKNAELPADGSAVFENLPAGVYTVVPLNRSSATLAPQAVELAEGETREVRLSGGSCTLAGRLRCAGSPTRVERVSCRSLGSRASFAAEASLEEEGRYRFAGLEPGAYELFVSAADALTQSFEVQLGDGETLFDVDLPAGRIEGRLHGVEFEPERNEFDRRHVLVFPLGWYQESGNRGVFLAPDADGRFTARHLPPGDYAVWVQRAKQRVESRVVTLTAAAPRQTLELGVVQELGVVAGRVVNGPGTRLSLAFLRREPQGLRRSDYAEVEATGEFRAELEPGRYAALLSDFEARAPFTLVPELAVTAGRTTALEFALPPARTLSVHLEAGAGFPPRRVWRLRMPTGEWLPYVLFVGSDAEGRRAPERAFQLPLGSYALEADFGDPVPLVREFEVVPGEGTQELVVPRPF